MRAKRLGVVGAACATAVAAAVGTAHASDDWYQIPDRTGLPYHQATGWMNYDNQATGWGRVDWDGTTVEVHAGAKQLAGSQGTCAVTQIKYQVKISGSWSWHSRSPAIDCQPDEKQDISPYYRSNYPVKDLKFRTCVGSPDGSVNEFYCTDWSW